MSDKPIGEWTADKVLMMGVNDAATAYNIADAHNAALAVEQERYDDKAMSEQPPSRPTYTDAELIERVKMMSGQELTYSNQYGMRFILSKYNEIFLNISALTHNAALDAEREQVTKEGIAGRLIFEQLRAQLAAEREKLTNQILNQAQLIEELSNQLAADRETRATDGQYLASKESELRSQLAAEREEWQLATEECHRIIHRKNEELAAERKKVKELEERLKSYDEHRSV